MKTKTFIGFILLILFILISYLSISYLYYKENNQWIAEYNILSLSFGYILADIWEKVTCNYMELNGEQIIGKYHYHHSLFGVIALLLAGTMYFFIDNVFLATYTAFWGCGTILQHTLSEKKFVFITRVL